MIKKNASSRILALCFLIGWILFAIYSYSQVDLNLTLLSSPLYLSFQQNMTILGYFNRPLSTVLFLVFLVFLFTVYIFLLKSVNEDGLNLRKWFWYVVFIYGINLFAYPAFSYDIYNYLFDARIITLHGLSPYYFRALDFPDDTWTRFMRWTHRYYPYGPVWLVLTLIPSYLGFGRFLPTLFLFKLMFMIASVLNIVLIYLISDRVFPKHKFWITAIYALNPLVIIESVMSPHNEVLMLLFALCGIYLILVKRTLPSLAFLALSIGVKFLSVSFMPFFFLRFWIKEKISDEHLLIVLLFAYCIAIIPVIILREMYAWYFIPIIALMSFFSRRAVVFFIIMAITLGELLRYAPFLWIGNWDPPVATFNSVVSVGLIIVGIIAGLFFPKRKKLFTHVANE